MRTPACPPEFHAWTMSDGYALRGRVWRPRSTAPRAATLYLHGIQSHGGWFEWSAALLAEARGQPVVLPDRRGSGLNQAARGDVPALARWLDDLDEVWDWAAREFGVAEAHVVGVSWGGKLAVAWALRHRERVRRVLLVAPGLFPAVDVGLTGRLRIGASLLTQPTRPVPIPLNEPALFTSNPEGQRFIAADPLKLTHATARFFYLSARLDHQLVRAPRGALAAEATLLLAGRERIVRNQPVVNWLQRIAARAPVTVFFPDADHTLEFEPDPARFGQVLGEWARA